MKNSVFVTTSTRPNLPIFAWHAISVFASKQFTNYGPKVQLLEAKIKNLFKLKNVVLMNNGTTPLIFLMSELPKGSKVLTTPFSFVATSSSIRALGLEIVFADLDPNSSKVNLREVETALSTSKIAAMLFTHVYGSPSDIAGLELLSMKYKVPLYFDAAHAIGVEVRGQSILNFGDANTISFHATKLLSCGEGGALITNSKEVADRARNWINFGIENGTITSLGINGKMSELQACLGLSTLPNLSKEMKRRSRLLKKYQDLLTDSPIVWLDSPNYSYFPALFPNKESLDAFIKITNREGIYPRKYFSPSLSELDFLNGQSVSGTPNSEDISARIVCLPSGRDVKSRVMNRVVAAANLALNGNHGY